MEEFVCDYTQPSPHGPVQRTTPGNQALELIPQKWIKAFGDLKESQMP